MGGVEWAFPAPLETMLAVALVFIDRNPMGE